MDIKDVEKLAELSRIKLAEGEKISLLSDMQGILEYVKEIEEVQVDDVVPEYQLYNVWREDEPATMEFSKELIREQFPDSQPVRPSDSGASGGVFLKVKKIL